MKNTKIDGRWLLGGSHLTLVLICVYFFDLQRTPFQIATAYAAALATELFFASFSKKNSHRTLPDTLFSAATEAAGLLILVRSSFSYGYAVFAAIAVSSKYLLRIDEKRHMFNPTNVAIVAGLVLIPRHYFEVRPDDFSQNFYPILHVLAFGLLAVYFGKRWRITLAYFSFCCLISVALTELSYDTGIFFLGPEVGAIGLIFMFLMITDPKTSPSSKAGQYLFGASVAVLLYIFRHFEVFYEHYFALFVVTLGRGIFEFVRANDFLYVDRALKLIGINRSQSIE